MFKMKQAKGYQKSAAKAVSMTIVNPNAAGIDVGDTIHAFAVPGDRAQISVRTFGTMSCDLNEIADWLQECRIDTVAMESTGVYWKPLFGLLIRRGIEVFLVNANHVRNVTGRKTDIGDAAWIQQLHSCGLLRSSYLPSENEESLRTFVRLRQTLIQDSSRCVLRMEKAMELMNLKLHTVIPISQVLLGRSIVEAIIAGEREAKNFLPLVHSRIKARPEVIEKSLQGQWRDDQLYALDQSYQCYCFFQSEIDKLDKKIEVELERYAASKNEGEIPAVEMETNKKRNKNAPAMNMSNFMKVILGTDVLKIYGLSELSALSILAETGSDMSQWLNEKHFVSWLNLCPNNKISGGKLLSSKVRKKSNSAGQAFRMAANSVQRSNHWLGEYFRRMKSKGGNKYAILATANKIATIYYKIVRNKVEFIPVDQTRYQTKRTADKIAYMERKLADLKGKMMDLLITNKFWLYRSSLRKAKNK
jgi:transposase